MTQDLQATRKTKETEQQHLGRLPKYTERKESKR
jgi:hypothetical protein